MNTLVQKKPWLEVKAYDIVEKLVDKKQVDEITFLKCQLGLATFFLEISKALVIYSLAYILGIMFEVIIYHIGYIMLRSSGLGAHAKTNNSCLFYSIVLIMGIPWLILVSNIMIGKPILIILWIINFCILAKYAPSTTMKNPIKDEKLKSKMRKRALLANLVLGLPLLVLPIGLAQLVIVGSTVATCMMLPITHQIFKSNK